MENQPNTVPPSSPAQSRAPATFAVIATLLAAGMGAYYNSLSVPFLFDDRLAIINNPTIRSLAPVAALAPPATGAPVTNRPIINYSFALNYVLGGLNAYGYHLTNIAIHLAAALALFGIVRRTLRLPALRLGFGDKATVIGFVVALWWLLHPLQTESVTYIAQRTESLMGLFYLLTLYAAIRAMQSPRPLGWQILAFTTCAAGMASKEVMVSAPLIVLLYDRTFVAGSFRSAWERRKWSYLSLASTWIILAWLVIASGGANRGGTAGFAAGITPWQYFLTQCVGIVRYMKLSLWPHPLVLDYGTALIRDPKAILPCFLLLAALACAILAGLRKRQAWGFLGIWFFAILAPSSSIVPVATQTLAEHRMYLPLAAVMTLAVVGLYRLTGRYFLPAGTAIALGLGSLTILRNQDYRSAVSIWRDTAAKSPDNPRAQYGLGAALLHIGRPADAIPAYERALRIDPDLPDAWSDLGLANKQLGRNQVAIRCYKQALRLNPSHAGANNNLGTLLYTAGRLPEAIQHYRLALQSEPDYSAAEYNLGLALVRIGQIPQATGEFRDAVHHDPTLVAAWCELAYTLERSGHIHGAIRSYEEALRRDPTSADARTGLAYLHLVIATTGSKPRRRRFAPALR